MITINSQIEKEFKLDNAQSSNLVEFFTSGATIPFIARYRKEMTGGLDEIELRAIKERYDYINEINERKETILKTIESQGKLTEELKKSIEDCLEKAKLEDIYLPFKPKRKTRATAAREKGLEPLTIFITSLTDPNADLLSEAAKYIDKEKGVATAEEALAGASDIFAEEIAEKAELRDFVRTKYFEKGIFVSKVRKEFEGKKTKFEMYYDYNVPVKSIPSHNLLAIRRAEKEDVITYEIQSDDDAILSHLNNNAIKIQKGAVHDFLSSAVKDGYERLMKLSLSADVRVEKKLEADVDAIKAFEINLRELLLSPPAGQVKILAVDPGFRTGCKVAVLSETGNFLGYDVIFPHEPQKDEAGAFVKLAKLIKSHDPAYIVIGNGTASRETERFVRSTVAKIPSSTKPGVVIVSEAGASVYSASDCAIREFSDLDLTLRSGISIGRRFQDPLSELIKIDPNAIGVGQYQHDVDQTLLKKKLEEVTESCVNFVGVDLNSASMELLSYVAGLNKNIADNIVKYRNTKGLFKQRKDLLNVPRLGEKAFEQCAGFLRIKNGPDPFDDSAVHPESYYAVNKIAESLNVPVKSLIANNELLSKIDPEKFADEKTGSITIRDIIEELKKPGRDPRAQFKYAEFRDDITEISHLKEGMVLEGSVTNVANFGAFVDIGVHQDGLVHVSKLADRYVKDPFSVVKVGQIVKVKVVSVDEALKRISLSMRSDDLIPGITKPEGQSKDHDKKKQDNIKGKPAQKPQPPKKSASIQDLIHKFQG